MILTGLALLFTGLFLYDIIRGSKDSGKADSFDFGYRAVLLGLALVFAWTPLKFWKFEKTLSIHASSFADRPGVKVQCTSVFDSIFDQYDVSRAGSAYVETGVIVFHYGWCKNFMDYLEDPLFPSDEALFGMHVFTHEVMHIRGELDERKTDCQAIQRNHLLGEQLGVNRLVARRNAVRYYKTLYPNHPYSSQDCGPNKKLDEKLLGSIWRDL